MAYDLGASGGKAFAGCIENGRLKSEEVLRFPNLPVRINGQLYWNILSLYENVKAGIQAIYHTHGYDVISIGIDSWAVDFGLLDKKGELVRNPYHYRNAIFAEGFSTLFEVLTRQEIYMKTGIQCMPINTSVQLHALVKERRVEFDQLRDVLMIPDLLRYFLTGEKQTEFTNATTTQLINVTTKTWDEEILSSIGVPRQIFQPVIPPGTHVGTLQAEVAKELNVPAFSVTTVAEHDTASAVVAVPTKEEDFAYISSGTWSLLGTEIKVPIVNDESMAINFTNEGGYKDTYRFIKNIMGLWIIQQCKAFWEKDRNSIAYDELNQWVEQASIRNVWIDPDAPVFLQPDDMPEKIKQYCRDTEQTVPNTHGDILFVVLESLALKYAYYLNKMERLTGKHYDKLHMVGGGIQNHLLCQFTANAIRRPVVTGPQEASAFGNIIVQLITNGKIENLREGRRMLSESITLQEYVPNKNEEWEATYHQFLERLHL
nr:rhamnulokinase family protein [Thalassobacillus sp. CUG 92003]